MICAGKYCDKKKQCRWYTGNADMLDGVPKPLFEVDLSRMRHFDGNPYCGDNAGNYYYYSPVTNYNRGE